MTDLIGCIAAFLTAFSFLPQTVKTIISNDTKGISLLTYLLFVAGVFLWMIYGIMISNQILIIANLITFLLAGKVLTVKIKNILTRKDHIFLAAAKPKAKKNFKRG